MIKGCQKKIIHIRNTKSPYFEEAYFVLKTDCDSFPPETDIIKEAMRIAESTKLSQNTAKKALLNRLTFILMGAGAVSLVFGIVMLITCFGS